MDPREESKRFTDALEELQAQRQQVTEDLLFLDPANPDQWDRTERAQRESDPGGSRPCLTYDQISQYASNVVGHVEDNPPGARALPVGSGADKRSAEVVDGLFRHVEHASRAVQHYSRAFTSCVRNGVGWLVVRPTIVDRALNFQEPRIGSEGDPLKGVIDPWSVEMDGSDASWGALISSHSVRQWEEAFGPTAEKVSFGAQEIETHDALGKTLYSAEVWSIKEEKRKIIICAVPDGDGGIEEVTHTEKEYIELKARGEPLEMIREDTEKRRVVRWARMSGAEELTKEVEYPASGIGLVPVYGYVTYRDGRLRYSGMARRGRDAQRAYNYHASEYRAAVAMAVKSPLLVPISAMVGGELKTLYDRASVDSRAYLPYQDWDATNNRTVNAPSRAPTGPMSLQEHLQGMETARRDLQAALAMYQANLGAPSNEHSGVAISRRKEQGETSNAHLTAHLAASVSQVAKLVFEVATKVFDKKRIVRVIGEDQTSGNVIIDPQAPKSWQEDAAGRIVMNPNLGKFDFRIITGQNFTTQRESAREALTGMMQANPASAPIIGIAIAQTLDIPGSEKLVQGLIAMAPPEVQAIYKPKDQQPSTIELQTKLQQAEQGMQQAVHVAESLEQEVDALKADASVKWYEAETKRMAALKDSMTPESIALVVRQTLMDIMSAPPDQQEPEPASADMQPFPAGGLEQQPQPPQGMQ